MKILNLDIIVRGFETASPFAKLILIILFFLSVLSWAIFIKKFFEFLFLKRRTRKFIKKYNEIPFEELFEKNPINFKKEILPSFILKLCINEAEKIKETPFKDELSSILFENIEKVYKREVEKLEKYIPVLATITSVSPFLGLLGTVWGIMEAFLEIKRTGSAHISVLAPGIADALITTIAGLLVAIPSLIFHNYFINETNKYDSLCQEFLKDVKIKIKKYLIFK
ncbi:MAG: MotA/TolQ/ExbB proton channel family protein [candidate division WOR-3 bacterium]